MSDKNLETKFLFDKIKRIYPTFQIPDEFDVECWTEILSGYSQDDILRALKAYRKTVEYNTPPTPASFSKFLFQENGTPDTKDYSKEVDIENVDPALGYYLRDVATKAGKDVHALLFYRWALRDIVAEMVETLPNGDKMSFGEKINIVRRNNWDSDITERATAYALGQEKRVGNVNSFVNTLASHWRM